MRQWGPGVIVVLLFGFMLFAPQAVFSGATDGLLLWFQIVLPTLFPFMLISGLLLETGGLRIISRIFGKLLGKLFAVSENGAFAVLAGFLCGYPMGAKVTADLIRSGRVTREEGAYLLSFCNNTSPVFIMNFLVWKTLGQEELTIPSLTILMAAPALLSILFRRFYLKDRKKFQSLRSEAEKKKMRLDLTVFDSCMMNSFESIVKVGGYIMFFSILIALFGEISGDLPFLAVIMPTLEVTNGIIMINNAVTDLSLSYPLILGLTSFGGFCSVAQTDCMIQGTGLRLLPYIAEKLAAALAASLLAYLYLSVF